VSSRRHADVEDLVFRGFLSTKIELGGLCVVLKSLNSRELAAVRERTPLQSNTKYEETFEALILAYAVYLIDGESALLDRPHNIAELVKEMREVPQNLRAEIMSEVLVLQKAQDVALRNIERFSYETSSRAVWRSYKRQNLNDPMLTGIAGTNTLGLNSHQVAWTYLNVEEDEREAAEASWGLAKFVASASNPKGVKKIESKDKSRLEKLFEERERIRLGQDFVGSGPRRIERRSVDELRAQLEADISGKQDLHDQILSHYENSLKERRQARAAEAQENLERSQNLIREQKEQLSDEELAKQLDESGFVTVYSPEQVKALKERQSQEALDKSRRAIEGQKKRKTDYAKDRQDLSRELQEIANTAPERFDLPTGPDGPVGPVRPSKPLPVRHTPPIKPKGVQRPVNVKQTGMCRTEIPGEEEFLRGSTTFGKDPK